ncbi:hypothetical protein [Streptomyces flaveolus]
MRTGVAVPLGEIGDQGIDAVQGGAAGLQERPRARTGEAAR